MQSSVTIEQKYVGNDSIAIGPINIELDEYGNHTEKNREIGFGDDYLEFDLDIYKEYKKVVGDYFTPDSCHTIDTSITVENLRMTDADGEVILLTHERKTEILEQIINAIIID